MAKHIQTIILALVLVIVAASFVSAEVEPTAPASMTYVQNWTVGGEGTGGSPLMLNDTRGFIYEYTINQSAQTPRWRAYVGNVTGQIKLGDGTNNIMSWDLTHVTGELFATRYSGTGVTGTLGQGSTGTIMWENVQCASQGLIDNETAALNHDPNTDVDALNLTMTDSPAYPFDSFTVAGRNINTGTCRGTWLYTDGNTAADNLWQEVVLEDTGDSQIDDLFYAVMLENNGVGFNNKPYDYQILLPDQGTDTVSTNTPYYFYIELSGNT